MGCCGPSLAQVKQTVVTCDLSPDPHPLSHPPPDNINTRDLGHHDTSPSIHVLQNINVNTLYTSQYEHHELELY